MDVLVQWAGRPEDWEPVASSDWSQAPSRPVPTEQDRVDGQRGWVNAINVQGCIFEADHYAVEQLPDGMCKVYAWNDDPDDWPDDRWGHVITFRPLAPDPKFGQAYNTNLTHEIYAEGPVAGAFPNAKPWADFPIPDVAIQRHGIWLPSGAMTAHLNARRTVGWREWTDGLPSDQIKDGRLVRQRSQGRYIRPKGTRTYFLNPEATAIGAVSATFESTLGTVPTTQTTQQETGINGNGQYCWTGATPASEPDSAAWPTTGEYRAQLDVVSASADITYGLRTQGTALGGFHRFNSTLGLILQTIQQAEAAFTLSGLKQGTVTNPAWLAGSAADRYGYTVAAVRVSGHGNKSLSLQVGETDDFTDGPWTAAPGGGMNNAIAGVNF